MWCWKFQIYFGIEVCDIERGVMFTDDRGRDFRSKVEWGMSHVLFFYIVEWLGFTNAIESLMSLQLEGNVPHWNIINVLFIVIFVCSLGRSGLEVLERNYCYEKCCLRIKIKIFIWLCIFVICFFCLQFFGVEQGC